MEVRWRGCVAWICVQVLILLSARQPFSWVFLVPCRIRSTSTTLSQAPVLNHGRMCFPILSPNSRNPVSPTLPPRCFGRTRKRSLASFTPFHSTASSVPRRSGSRGPIGAGYTAIAGDPVAPEPEGRRGVLRACHGRGMEARARPGGRRWRRRGEGSPRVAAPRAA